jgi:hypothetical protein
MKTSEENRDQCIQPLRPQAQYRHDSLFGQRYGADRHHGSAAGRGADRALPVRPHHLHGGWHPRRPSYLLP